MPKVRKNTTVIIGEGPTEFYYLNSLKDEFRELQNIKPDTPKNTSLKELERSIETAIIMGYDRIFCLIDMDTKKKDRTSWNAYAKLKSKYHGKKVSNDRKGVNYEVRFFETDRCTELFFLYYFKYVGHSFSDSQSVERELSHWCGYEKTRKFFASHPLHQFFIKEGGDFNNAIRNAIKSEECVSRGDRDFTYSELGTMFKELGILENPQQ